ncbi:cyclin-dependent kinase 14-like isoform X2 [Babylonia areolata]|uniref:cyclin-dependent kinase 14-like isoform X2 n=1 Tax=Babylonia areolata TaxID=304850 RepID=UPI003FD3761E
MKTSVVSFKDGKDKSQVSRIKKLKRRISASFGRLSLSKEDTIHEGDEDRSLANAPPVFGNSICAEDKCFSAPDILPTANGRHVYNGCHGEGDRLSAHPGYHQHQHHHPAAPPDHAFHPSSLTSTSSSSSGRSAAKKKHPPVKRHNSAGDMLISSHPPSSQADSRTVAVSERTQRPKSEGHAYSRHVLSKRTSSYGGSSPFGRADSYHKLEQLGEGSYATVYKGFSSLTNQIIALKEIRLQEEEGAPFTAIREASLLKGLRHANIVTLHDIIHTKETLTFVFEYVHTDLSQYLEKYPGGLNAFNVKLFLYQLLRGLGYCHERRILHRDIKPQNLLISEMGELKLADFGLARAKSIPSHTYSHEVVTLWYRPPDILLGSTQYSTSLDMWGVGCIFTEMISGQATFPGMKDAYDQLDKIFKILGTPNEQTWEGVTRFPHFNTNKFGLYQKQPLYCCVPKLSFVPHAAELAARFLEMEPTRRISAVVARQHEYFLDLPPKIHELPDAASIFNIPGLRPQSEVDETVSSSRRTTGRSGIRTTLKV